MMRLRNMGKTVFTGVFSLMVGVCLVSSASVGVAFGVEGNTQASQTANTQNTADNAGQSQDSNTMVANVTEAATTEDQGSDNSQEQENAVNDARDTHAADDQDVASGNVVNTQQLPDSSFIYDTPLVDLATADAYYDGLQVQVTGEVVGDLIKADLDGSYYWVTLSATEQGTTSTLVVYMPAASTKSIDTLGSYKATGTTLQVRGIFHLACSEHQGVSDVHAQNVTVTAKGAVREHAFNVYDYLPGLVLVLAGGLMSLAFWRLRERQR